MLCGARSRRAPAVVLGASDLGSRRQPSRRRIRASPTATRSTKRGHHGFERRRRNPAVHALQDAYANVIDTRIPVTVITGFLGSGKTTLLNHILTKNHGRRIAVIENEFGEIDIDSDLVSQKDSVDGSGDTIMMLNNGCLCCTMREDLIKSLNALYERRDEFDHIIIETTGLANVSPIISTFYLAERLPERVRLDGVVTVVDAKHVQRHMNDVTGRENGNETVEQIAYADRIILNKTDLVEDVELAALETRVRKINAMAVVSRSTYSAVSVDYVLGIGGFDVTRVGEQLLTPGPPTHSHSHDHGHRHEHDDDVTSVSVMLDGDVDLDRINTILGAIVEMRGEDIYRMKGIVAIQGWQERFVFQGVHTMFDGIPDRLWHPDEKRITKMVFIGRNLDQADFEEALNTCRVH